MSCNILYVLSPAIDQPLLLTMQLFLHHIIVNFISSMYIVIYGCNQSFSSAQYLSLADVNIITMQISLLQLQYEPLSVLLYHVYSSVTYLLICYTKLACLNFSAFFIYSTIIVNVITKNKNNQYKKTKLSQVQLHAGAQWPTFYAASRKGRFFFHFVWAYA
jgi:hypothetical protein